MIEAIAEIIEAAQEVAISIEKCRISISVIEDLHSLFEELSESESEIESLADSESFDNGISDMSGQQLEARSTFIKDGHSYETDDRGNPFKKDGELIPETEYISNGGKYYVDSNGNVEVLEEGYQSSYKERLAQTPVEGDRGTWEGTRGESRYRPNQETESGSKAIEKLREYGIEGIDYQDAIPNFDKCAEETVEIDMTENRYSNVSDGITGNFEKADTECAQKWADAKKDGRSDWTARDVADYRRNHNMTWHECIDRKTCQMISRDIHDYFGHSGGVSECKKALGSNYGGGFDV